ncbi:MAG: hypothetical protein ACK56A_09960, partial [Bacteroidota bacterium]
MKTELSGSHAGASITESTSADAVNDILMAGNKSKGGRPYFLDDPAVERVLNISMAVAAEVAVLHERMDTIERLLEAKGVLSRKEIEEYVPDDQAAEERQTWHARFTARILRIVQQEVEAVAHPENNV